MSSSVMPIATNPQRDGTSDRAIQRSQEVRFAQAGDGASLAWTAVGPVDGPPIVKAANWLSHLALDWQAPIWSPLFRELARRHRFVRYDERGCGLSDWHVPEISFEAFVSDLETVVDATGLERFALLGISQGAAVSIEYAVRHPERVSRLILFGGYDAGWCHGATAQEMREREAVMVLVEAGWGREDPAFRHLFSQTFMPTATGEELDWFDDFQRRTTSPKNAVRFLEAFSRIDVRSRLAQLRVPTLVLHSRSDQRIPCMTGRRMAATIPGAEFVGLESSNHLLLGRESASRALLEAVQEFLAR
jgi:pimeloyl-ACP methyl ester carboxylesterase